MAKRPARPTQKELDEALASPYTPGNSLRRRDVFVAFSYYEPEVSQIPFIRKALNDEDNGVVQAAAIAAGRLGPKGKELQDALYDAAGYSSRGFAPGAYSECLNALVSIEAEEGCILDLVQCHFAITNWSFLKDSLHALKRLGTEDALDLMTRIITFAKPDLDKKQEKYIKEHFPEGYSTKGT